MLTARLDVHLILIDFAIYFLSPISIYRLTRSRKSALFLQLNLKPTCDSILFCIAARVAPPLFILRTSRHTSASF
ncbi:hypothetical protein KPP2020_074 [Klebsiella phage KPP2020]|uniref:Uncharacterized protein n=1 Tax=Klebsiella phage KPP2020 TaxID=3017288 RepID=A0AAE9YK63_9CAUD|nr:hypothetical protein KPP2020_074 [Klebsiella phage KPP2020]